MLYLAAKALRSGVIVAGHALVVLPSLPMFLVLPALLRHGLAFYPALGICLAMTTLLYLGMAFGLGRFGIDL